MAHTMRQEVARRRHSESTKAGFYWMLGVFAILCFAFFFARNTKSYTQPQAQTQPQQLQQQQQVAPQPIYTLPPPALGSNFQSNPSGIYGASSPAPNNLLNQQPQPQDQNSLIYDHTDKGTNSPNAVNTNNGMNAPIKQQH